MIATDHSDQTENINKLTHNEKKAQGGGKGERGAILASWQHWTIAGHPKMFSGYRETILAVGMLMSVWVWRLLTVLNTPG